MSSKRTGRGAWGGLLLMFAPALAIAQDRPATGPSTNEPETNKTAPQNPLSGVKPVTPKNPDQVLPGVPATATDPAPPGTRSVRVDLKPGAASASASGAKRPGASMRSVEGIVTAINKKGSDLRNETVRITIDPAQGWESFTGGPSVTPANPTTAAVGDPNLAPLEVVLTGRTYTFAHARTADGVDLVGATTESSPDDAQLRSDALGSHQRLRRTSDPETSWTNIKVGSYVSVRFQQSGKLNEARNVSLIQLPLNPEAATESTGRPGATTGKSGAPTIPETKTPTSPGAVPH